MTYYLLISLKWHALGNLGYSGGGIPPRWRSVREYRNNRAEFLRRSGPRNSRRSLWTSPNTPPASSNKKFRVHGHTARLVPETNQSGVALILRTRMLHKVAVEGA